MGQHMMGLDMMGLDMMGLDMMGLHMMGLHMMGLDMMGLHMMGLDMMVTSAFQNFLGRGTCCPSNAGTGRQKEASTSTRQIWCSLHPPVRGRS